jgi:hypothetical protein
MVRKDFEDGGFPINNRAPVLCITDEGAVFLVYNNYDLKELLEKKLGIKKLLGVWPGKRMTDLFVLNPGKYGKNAPPVEHKEIDNAEKVIIAYNKQDIFLSVIYTLPGGSPIISKDPLLGAYLKSSGRKYAVRYIE